ncbi:hypothetical protein [Acinetobacter phage HZY2308]|nr:hypothetical protein [Acinetobacter phage HZY2308]
MEDLKINVSNLSNDEKLGVLNDLVFLGYKKHTDDWMPGRLNECGFYIAYAPPYKIEWDIICMWEDCKNREISIHQLRDLVVLKRNDVSDANYRSKSVLDGFYFKSCDGVFYFMFEGKWVRSTTNTDEGLEPITKGSDLISGAEALRALADGANPEDIEIRFSNGYTTSFISTDDKLGFIVRHLNEKLFRLKPKTIKLELELPKPFEPKEDCYVYIIDDYQVSGYRKYYFEVKHDNQLGSIGAWRTEAEVKQVIEQLRKIKGAV